MTGGAAVSASIDVAVDPATAFAVFTAEIDHWYQRTPHSWMDATRARAIRFEAGVGGRLLEVYDEERGEGFELGRVLVWEPPNRLVFADYTASTPPDPVTEVEVRFDAVDAGTRVTLEHRGLDLLPADVAEQKRKYGWQTLLAWYAEHFAPS